MKILVCISHVPDTTSKINFNSEMTEFDSTGVQFVINPHDEFALTRAMWFKEKQGAEVTVINVGDSSTEPTLRKALAIGADKAIRINTAALDGFQVAQEIAEVQKSEQFDLILTGRESIDYNGGMVPGILASLCEMNFVNACVSIEVEGSDATCKREIDGGTETIKLTLPAVVSGQKGMVEEKDLKIPNMRGIMMARKKPLTVLESNGSHAATTDNKFEKPAQKSACKIVDASNLDELINLLHTEAKVL
ncbi:MAG: electron transfer flavoprotein subunit beta/FixA family protein [Flavobacteriaceae bacterium]